jgi:hypothetical protein
MCYALHLLKKTAARNRQLPVILSSNWFVLSSAHGVVVSVVDFKQWGRWFKTDSVKKKINRLFQNRVSFTELGAFVLLLCFNTNMCFFCHSSAGSTIFESPVISTSRYLPSSYSITTLISQVKYFPNSINLKSVACFS